VKGPTLALWLLSAAELRVTVGNGAAMMTGKEGIFIPIKE
jgi:hypothetical protein